MTENASKGFYELESQFYELTYTQVFDLADQGKPDAIDFLEQVKQNGKIFGSMWADKFAGSIHPDPRHDPFLRKYLKFFSKERIFNINRWNYGIKEAYNNYRNEYYYVQEKIWVHKPEYFLYVFYHIILPTAAFLAWADFPTYRDRNRHALWEDKGHTFVTNIRTEIEQILFDGCSSDCDEYKERIRDCIEYIEELDDSDDIDYDSGGYSSMSSRNRSRFMLYVANKIEDAKGNEPVKRVSGFSTIDGFLYDEAMQKKELAMDLLERFSDEDRLLLVIKQGDLTKLAKERGIDPKTLSKQRRKIIKELQQKYDKPKIELDSWPKRKEQIFRKYGVPKLSGENRIN